MVLPQFLITRITKRMIILEEIMDSRISETRCNYVKRWIIDLWKTIKLYRYYRLFPKKITIDGEKKIIVFMADGRMLHGGLSDRLSGIVSTFQYCQQNEIEFRINFVFPFRLEQFLEPNEYDWRITPDDLSYNLNYSKPIYISLFSHEIDTQRRYAESRLKRLTCQNHLYSNMRYFTNGEFGHYFNILFRKTQLLENEIEKRTASIGTDYISVTFRFQQLLGDFKETGFPILKDEAEKKNLVERCLACIEKLYIETTGRILVTSDSSSFLQEAASRFSYVYIMPGSVVHIDYVSANDNISQSTYLKSFVDFFMLANAKHIYLAAIKPLYHSYFPEMASWVYGKPFHVIS